MVFSATHAAFLVSLCWGIAANTDQPMKGNVNDTVNDTRTNVSSVVMDAAVAKEAISALMIETKGLSEKREAENFMYQNLYKRETTLGDSLLKDVKRSKDLHLSKALMGLVDEAMMEVEQAQTVEQAAQRRYEGSMKSLNTHIQALGQFAAGEAKQSTTGSPLLIRHESEPLSMADWQATRSLLIQGDRVKLLTPQPTWNPPLIVGSEGTVIEFHNDTHLAVVRFDAFITGNLLSKNLQKIEAGHVMI